MVDSNSLERRIIEDSGKKYEEISFTILQLSHFYINIKQLEIKKELYKKTNGRAIIDQVC